MAEIADWSTLDTAERRHRQADARMHARALDPILNAFVQIDTAPLSPTSAVALGGLPYAAKDMLRTSSHCPCGGFGDAGDLGIAGSSD